MDKQKQELIAGPIYGYKATDKDMKCRGYQFKIGKRHVLESEKEIAECQNGFDFCLYPSGVWAYYSAEDRRVFKVCAFDVLRKDDTPGADCKKVCREIELIEEIEIGGDGNTGDWNTGNWNTGNWNTGDSNTGDWNTGYSNTGYSNTGDGNTGYSNTGDWNTGNSNTGDGNTGDSNTGYRNTGNWNTGYSNTGYSNTGNSNTGDGNTGYSNTGDSNTGNRNTGNSNTGYRNTGDWNTGYSNTGDGNCCDRSTGHFNSKTQPIRMFDKIVKKGDVVDEDLVYDLCCRLRSDSDFDVTPYLELPNATSQKIQALHKKHIEARKANKQ